MKDRNDLSMENKAADKKHLPEDRIILKRNCRGWFLGIAVLWAVLFIIGYPLPHVDDLFFSGAGVSIAKGEGLKNPWLKPWLAHFGTDKFYAQTTFHAYLMGWWLKIFGISAKAILSFQCLANFASTCLLVSLLKRAGFTAAMSAGALAYFVLFTFSCGLRPEILGILCIFGAIRLWLEKETWKWFLGCFLAACAPLFTPFHFSIIVPLGLAWLRFKSINKISSRDIYLKTLAACTGVLFAYAFLVVSVNFQIVEFLQTIKLVAASKIPQGTGKVKVLWDQLCLGYEPIFKMPSYLFPYYVFAIRLIQKKSKSYHDNLVPSFMVLMGFTVLAFLSYTQQVTKYLPILSLLVGGLMVAKWLPSTTRRFVQAAWFFVLGLALIPALLHEVLMGIQIQNNSAETQEKVGIIKQIEKDGKTLFLDEHAIRYFYDFRPPAHTLDWLHCRDPRSLISRLEDKPAAASWLVDSKKLALYVPDSGVTLRPLVLLGRKFYSFSSNQSEIRYFR
jgi:hypothetical protein